MTISNTSPIDDAINPQEFVAKAVRLREEGVPFQKSKRAKPKEQQRSNHFYELKAELQQMRPGFSCDWDSTSDAMLQNILTIERDKYRNHYGMLEKPPAQATVQQPDMNAQILAGITALGNELKKINRRVSKLEKVK
jgi:hypothetical protein